MPTKIIISMIFATIKQVCCSIIKLSANNLLPSGSRCVCTHFFLGASPRYITTTSALRYFKFSCFIFRLSCFPAGRLNGIMSHSSALPRVSHPAVEQTSVVLVLIWDALRPGGLLSPHPAAGGELVHMLLCWPHWGYRTEEGQFILGMKNWLVKQLNIIQLLVVTIYIILLFINVIQTFV